EAKLELAEHEGQPAAPRFDETPADLRKALGNFLLQQRMKGAHDRKAKLRQRIRLVEEIVNQPGIVAGMKAYRHVQILCDLVQGKEIRIPQLPIIAKAVH